MLQARTRLFRSVREVLLAALIVLCVGAIVAVPVVYAAGWNTASQFACGHSADS